MNEKRTKQEIENQMYISGGIFTYLGGVIYRLERGDFDTVEKVILELQDHIDRHKKENDYLQELL